MFARRLVVMLAVAGTACGTGAALAQEDLTRGKTPAQLYTSDCAGCHRNPRGLAKGDARSVAAFLRVHYTASRESAAAIAAYLVSLGPDPRGGSPRPATAPRRPAASQEQGKPQSQAAQPAAKPNEPAPAPKPPEPVSETPPAAAPATAPPSEPPAPATPPAPAANPQ